METRHRCRLCFKRFANGRALGGHMRSHMMNPPPTATPFRPPPPPPPQPPHVDLRRGETELPGSETSASSPPSSSDEETEYYYYDDEDDDSTSKGLTSYEVPRRECPKQRGGASRVADPESSLLRLPTEAAGSSSGIIMLQDRESETESSKKPTRRRSKRSRRSFLISDDDRINTRCYYVNDNINNNKKVQENSNEGEPVSSISEVSPEEDVAFCLMMLSQDKWNRGSQKKRKKERKMKKIHDDDGDGGGGGGHMDADIKTDVYIDDDNDDGDHEEEEVKLSESTQVSDHEEELTFTKSNDKKKNNNNNSSNSRGKYKCETCSKAFRSYQALGGHRASHKKFRVSAAGSTPENKKGCDGEDDERKRGSHRHGDQEEEKKRIHECPVCLRVFASGQALGGHKRSHVIIHRGERTKVAEEEELEESKEDIVGSGKWIDLNLPAPIDDDDYEISQIAISAVSDSVNL